MKQPGAAWKSAVAGLVILGWAGGAWAREMVVSPRVTTTQWRTHLADAPIEALHVYVRKAGGGAKTYFNMRFGREGHSFEGRRVYLGGRDLVRSSWAMHGRSPGGKELILNAYNGSVHVEKVVVVYAGRGPSPGAGPWRDGRRYEPGYRDGYGPGMYGDEFGSPRQPLRYRGPDPGYGGWGQVPYAVEAQGCECCGHLQPETHGPYESYRGRDSGRYRRPW